ncbi:MAG: hypothetical protein K8L99_19825 [Anaerolineae bacterium]|nr:hypothetical protein [Anaerolineae bacterium]
MNELPVREMVLYKHGVGFFVREGPMEGEQITLTFRQDEINDVLKSLSVFDQGGGQVLGIHYQTPQDQAARFANTSIHLDPNHSLADLLISLRGRQVILGVVIEDGSMQEFRGRLIGLDQWAKTQDYSQRPVVVSLLREDGQVSAFRFSDLRTIRLEDGQAQYDLGYFLDTSMAEDTRRAVNVRLSAGEHQLVVFYVAPSPTWRVSYRLVGEFDSETKTGKALLQGWGLFDNRLEEDLDAVRVTLVAGQPISFIYDLFTSRIPQRPTVADEARVAPGPIEYAASMQAEIADEVEPEPMRGRAPMLGAISAKRFAPQAMAQAAPAAAETREAGEFFQYVVTTPVSVKRGESALVPILNSELNYERELLYNGDKLPNHPVAALRFTNSSGLTLERGPVTLVEDGDYKGEAVVPFTRPDNPVYLPYAVELGIKVTEKRTSSRQTTGLHIEGALLVYEEYLIEQINYALENTTGKAQTVTIEATRQDDWELFGTRMADAELTDALRWKIEVEAHSTGMFTRKQRYRTHRHEELSNLSYQKLQQFLEKQWLDQAIIGNLSVLLDNYALIQQAQKQRETLQAERQTIYGQQEQLRANLGALGSSEAEAALRARLLRDLESTQDRLDAIDKDMTSIKARVEEAEKRIESMIEKLGKPA